MKRKIAINGLGRIGRLVVRELFSQKRQASSKKIELIAINDLIDAEYIAHLLKYDTVHGRFPGEIEVSVRKDQILINGSPIQVLNIKDPASLPWKSLGIDYVIESTGRFTQYDEAKMHLNAGAKRVIISAPAKGDVSTFVMGVNHQKYNPQKDFILSNASCTTNCAAPIVKILQDAYGIDEALLTTVHAITASQPSVDAPAKKDWRGGRAAAQNIIPATTGAAKAVTLTLPELEGKITGMAFRVPVPDVSVIDLSVRLSQETSYEHICATMKRAAEGAFKGLLSYCDEEVVSSDFIGDTHSAIFDAKAGLELNSRFFKIIAWYDNETGYAKRILDLASFMAEQEV